MEKYNQNYNLETNETVAILEEKIRQKDEFLSLATHQIRGPIGAIKGYISLLLEGDYGVVPPEFQEPLNIILNSADSMSKTVNDFLDISRIDLGEMRYYRKDFDLTNLIQEVVNEMKKDIQDLGLELKINMSAEVAMIHADKAKIKHVIHNLIDNASKYTKKGWIELSLQKSVDNKIIFCVKDSGVGIRAETMPKLFQRFSRCDEADKSNLLGTGLGLYIARKMLEAQNGRIWAESAGENKGAQFYMEIPSLN